MYDDRLLFSLFQLGTLTLQNHLAMAPLIRSRANDEGIQSPFASKYYAGRASAGVGKRSRKLEGVPFDFLALCNRFDGIYNADNMYTAETAEQALKAGDVDLVFFGRPFLANPDLVHRLQIGTELVEAPIES
jgi:2,4-dienoyl-CoA reductase-like NADH-dependent reductase (Old Yellow Enzyme family)